MNKLRITLVVLVFACVTLMNTINAYFAVTLIPILGILFNLDYILVLIGKTKKITLDGLNDSYQYVSDTKKYGVADYWAVCIQIVKENTKVIVKTTLQR